MLKVRWILCSLLCFVLIATAIPARAANQGHLFDYFATDMVKPHYAQRPEVRNQIDWYLNHKKFLYNVINQGEPYLFYIFHEVQQRDLPSELALLPLIESAYDPFAHSWVGAAGLWQFMPKTAKGLGIKQNWWYDGRRDIVSSTESALQYLTYLHRFFDGNWLLAVASYNCGEGTVQRAIKYNAERGKKTDFWSLDLPQQTKEYVPRFLALSLIVRNPSAYGVQLPKLAAAPYFTSVDVGQQIDLAHAATMAEISLNELYQLNPGYSRWTTGPNGPHTLLLPVDKVGVFHTNFAKNTGKNPVIHPIGKHGLRLANRTAPLPTKKATHKTLTKPSKALAHDATYRVKSGDTLYKIARHYHVSVDALQRANHLTNAALQPGDVMRIPQEVAIAHKPSPPEKFLIKTKRYVVKAGDNLRDIANRYHVSIHSIVEANALTSERLRVDQLLFIPA